MVKDCLLGQGLTESQRKALIVLIFKGGDNNLISSWRPISLISVDAKIISKIIAARIRPLLDKCISREQHCCGDQSIIPCNNTTSWPFGPALSVLQCGQCFGAISVLVQ